MGVTAHLKELETKHAAIDVKIRAEQKTPLPDSLRISKLKKQKLQIKQRIQAHLDK